MKKFTKEYVEYTESSLELKELENELMTYKTEEFLRRRKTHYGGDVKGA